MKTLLIFTCFLGSMLFTSCDTTQSVASTPASELSDFFRNVSGISVIGNGQTATIRMRGLTNYYGNEEPLFVLDGIEVGSFYQLTERVTADEITRVKILHPTEALMYGQRRLNGVIEISTL